MRQRSPSRRKVLVAGGENLAGTSDATSELYNPVTGAWSPTGAMHAGRLEHRAVLLRNGAVLVSGGNSVNPSTTTVLNSAELFNPVTGAWSTTGAMRAARVGHSSTLLPSGSVLNAGGSNAATELGSAEIYAP